MSCLKKKKKQTRICYRDQIWPTNPKIITIWPFTKKAVDPDYELQIQCQRKEQVAGESTHFLYRICKHVNTVNIYI